MRQKLVRVDEESVIRDLGPSLRLDACTGGNLSEERFSPRPPSKDFSQQSRRPGRLALTA